MRQTVLKLYQSNLGKIKGKQGNYCRRENIARAHSMYLSATSFCAAVVFYEKYVGVSNFILTFGGGGSNPKNGEKSIRKEREINTFQSLSIYFFFPFFPMGKWEKTHFSHGQKWGWTPLPPHV